MNEEMSKLESYKNLLRDFYEDTSKPLPKEEFDQYLNDPIFWEALKSYINENSSPHIEEPDSNDLFVKIKHDKRIQGQLNEVARERSISYLKWISIAAACLIIGIGATTIWYQNNAEIKENVVSGVEQILPGSEKAHIILDNGRRIDLDNIKGDSVIDNDAFEIVKSSDGFISYRIKKHAVANSKLVYNTIVTPRGGEYRLQLPDGTKVWLNAMTSLRYPIQFATSIREVDLEGEAYFEVARKALLGQLVPFIIHAADQKLQVLGTAFNIQSYDNTVVTTLVEGKVKLSFNKNETKEHFMEPQDQIIFNKSNRQVIKTKVDPFYYSAWKEGNFAFDKMPIEEVMHVISRWYDVDIEFKNKLRDFEFTGTVSKYEDLNKLLQTIELLGGVQFELRGRKIYVTD